MIMFHGRLGCLKLCIQLILKNMSPHKIYLTGLLFGRLPPNQMNLLSNSPIIDEKDFDVPEQLPQPPLPAPRKPIPAPRKVVTPTVSDRSTVIQIQQSRPLNPVKQVAIKTSQSQLRFLICRSGSLILRFAENLKISA